MPEPEPERTAPTRSIIPSHEWWTAIISAVDRPLAFFTAAALVFLVVCVVCSLNIGSSPIAIAVVMGMAVLGLIMLVVVVGRLVQSDHLQTRPATKHDRSRTFDSDVTPVHSFSDVGSVESARLRWESILGADKDPPNVDAWYRRLRPSLHQASYYTVPTYYLDNDLYVVDYNIAFEIIFGELAGQLRGRHVNWLIEQMANADEVYEHGREFSDQVRETGSFPLVDLEPISYESPAFGRVEFTKVASQLHNAEESSEAGPWP